MADHGISVLVLTTVVAGKIVILTDRESQNADGAQIFAETCYTASFQPSSTRRYHCRSIASAFKTQANIKTFYDRVTISSSFSPASRTKSRANSRAQTDAEAKAETGASTSTIITCTFKRYPRSILCPATLAHSDDFRNNAGVSDMINGCRMGRTWRGGIYHFTTIHCLVHFV